MVTDCTSTASSLPGAGRAGEDDATARPWLALYEAGQPATFAPAARTGLELFERGPALRPDAPSIHYFDSTLTFRETDAIAHALAVGLRELGVGRGDRVALMMQNVPQMPIAMHASWLLGAAVTPVSPMHKGRELEQQLCDAGVRTILCLESLADVVAAVRATTPLEHVVTVSELDYLERVPTLLADHERRDRADAVRFADVVAAHAGRRVEEQQAPAGSDPAILTYTSGTTGPPKGAVNTHACVAYNAETFQRWIGLTADDVTVAMAPLFHSTGLIGHIAVSRLAMSPLLLSYRFDAGEMLRLIERWRGAWMLGPLTAYLAMLDHPDFDRRDLGSLTKVCSGGAPVRPPIVARFESRVGRYVHNMFGMTETTGPTLCVPMGARAPVDDETGALAVGVPVYGVDARIVDPQSGADLPAGEVGEIALRGPMVMAGYWGKPEETARAIRDGWLFTGDLGKRDEAGWFYVVDRLKDLINASGYKVWPRDVEDALQRHPAVREAAVVGIPDDYRGETVKAFVALEPDAAVTPAELIAHCREQLAVYKVPRELVLVRELPKNAAGKVLRRDLRPPAPARSDAPSGSS